LSHLDLEFMSINYPTLSAAADLAHFRHFSSLFTHFRSTTVENSLQITPFYAKQSQFWKCQNQHKCYYSHELRKKGQLVIQTKQTQFKPNQSQKQTQFKPNLSRRSLKRRRICRKAKKVANFKRHSGPAVY
jgi:hypothetical protein